MLFEQAAKKIYKVEITVIVLIIALILKVGYIQLVNRNEIYGKALESWQRSFPVQANRGKIYDSTGHVLASDLTTSSLVVVPSQIYDKATTALQLAKILNVSTSDLKEKIEKKVSIQRISPEGRQLDDDIARAIQRLNLSGVYLIKDTKRYYPFHQYLSHCLGFVGIDNQGLLGLELEYDEYLRGENGSINYYMDAKSHNLKMYPSDYVSPQSGMNITLTIHKDIQDIVERELNNAYDIYHPEGIWALAMNPQNGDILAISSKPDFDPNDYQNSSQDIYNHNIPIWKTYEPGSTFKIITFSSALNEKLFDMDKDTYYDQGYEYVSGAKIKSWKKGGHGLQTFREVLQNSSNPGFVEIGRRLGKERLYQYVKDFGLTEKTGVDLPGESSGIMFSYENFHELEQATVAFGQGISITPIQLVRAICACVNGGELLKPHILKQISNSSNNDIVYQRKKEVIRTVISEETSHKVCDALESVVAEGGGRNAYIEGYRIGGKTGTAQKAVNGSYVGGGYILSFVGIAPIDDPKIVLYIAMDNPKNCVQYGGTTVAPIARKMLLDILPALDIKKSNQQKEKTYSVTDVKKVKVDNYIGQNKNEINNSQVRFKYIGNGKTVIDQLPRKGEYINEGDTIVLMMG